ncbi:MAG TPA: hypothetical protein VIG47_01035, partial [Gemmatimonadaceae bacterium]
MNTDLDELQTKWAAYDRRVETSIRLSREVLNAINMRRAVPPLRSLTIALVVEAIATFAVIVALGAFIFANHGALQFAVPAVALDVYAIAYFQGLIRQMVAVYEINLAQPVTIVQTKFAQLRLLRLRYTKLTFLAIALAWTPLLIVGLKAFGLDAYALFGGAYLAANVLFGLAVIPLAIWVSKAFGARLASVGFIRGLVQALEGHSLAR